jgi:hypothetical protein
MRRAFAFGLVVGTLLPVAARAQDNLRPTAGQQMFQMAGMAEKAPTPLPVTLDVATPDYEALARINANPTLASTAPVGSPAAQALNAGVDSGIPTQMPGGTYPTATAGVASDGSIASNGLKAPSTDISHGGTLERIGLVYNWRHNTGPVRDWLRLYEPQVFQAGVWSVEYGTQYWTSPLWGQSPRRTYFLPQIVRIGYQLNDPGTSRFERLKGSWEVLAEMDTIPIMGGPGKDTTMIGGSGLLRYHVVVNHRIVPYFQIGFGGLYTRSYQFPNAPTDTPFNFMTQIASGSHLFLNDKWALMTESSFVFINNFGIGRSPGYYVLGGLFGITRYFGGHERCTQ